MKKKYFFVVLCFLVIIFIFIIKLVLSGYFVGKSSDPNICNNLKDDEICVCEKYNPPICRVEKK